MSSKKTCLITGARGLVGSALVPFLLKEFDVFALVRNVPAEKITGVQYISVDLSTDWRTGLLPAKTDMIIHLAQSENFRYFPQKAMDIFNVNTYSTLKLLDYARSIGAGKFIYASSGGIYGSSDSGFTEDTPIISRDNLGFYIGTKFCSEIIAENYSSSLDVDIIRFFFVYGPQQRKTMLIPRLVSNINEGKAVSLQGDEGIKINPIYVDDAAALLFKCMALKGSHKINIGGVEVLTLRAICEIIGKVTGKKPVYENVKGAVANHLFGDISKMKKLLGTPLVTFEEGVKKIV